MNRKLPSVLPAFLLVSTMIGCGTPGAPEPPSLNLPMPVLNLSAVRTGNAVRLAWTMPLRTTDRAALRHPVTAQVCRAVENLPCATIAGLTFPPGGAAAYVDELPPDLAHEPDRLLRYEVALLNHAGKSAGPSNAAYSAAGVSPALLQGFSAQAGQDGVLLSWQPVADQGRVLLFRIQRLQLTTAPETPKSPFAPSTPAAAQTLVVHGLDDVDPGHAVDTSALFNQRYRYLLQRVATLSLSGHAVEVQGPPSETIEVMTTDVFPPAVPQGLVAVADSAAGAIDLSWSPDGDSDLAAYHLYRRDIHEASPALRISSLRGETSFRDTAVQPGHTYGYSVSAVDQNGNESKHSAEAEETLPNR